MVRTTAADRLAFFVLAVLGVLAALERQPVLVALVTFVAFVLIAIATWAQHGATGELVHKIGSPYLAVGTTFELLGPLIPRVTSARWDDALAALDERRFGGLVAAWQGLLGRPAWLTDAMSLAYVSFYFVPLAVGFGIYRRHPEQFDRYALVTEAGFFIPYIGYLSMPASGPREAFAEGAAIGGTAVGEAARHFIRTVELNMLDAFPSGHTSVVLIVLAFGWRLLPKWRAPLTLVVASIIFSTVYLSYHYFVDLLAGALIALFMPLLAPLGRVFGLHDTPRPVQSPSIDIRSG